MPSFDVNLFRILAENSADMISCVDLDHVTLYASPSHTRILGWQPEELVGTTPEFYVHPGDLPRLYAMFAQRDLTQAQPPITLRFRCKDDTFAWVEVKAGPVLDPQSRLPTQVVLVIRDVTENRLREQELAALAHTDALTGLLNRRGFDRCLLETWTETVGHGTQMSLLLLDVDHFKSFNDQHGHQMGDDCLRAVACAVAGCLELKTDQAARYGGEEIAIILPETDGERARQIAEGIRHAVLALRLPNAGSPESGHLVSVSVGAATALSRKGGSMRMPENLLLSADKALYVAKRGGRNRVEASFFMTASQS